MSETTRVILIILTVAAVTLMLRVLPFIIFGKRKTPPFIEYLGRYLPYAVMGMLVVYCLKSTTLISEPFGLPEAVSVLVVVEDVVDVVEVDVVVEVVQVVVTSFLLLEVSVSVLP